jgi:hypothetical protein
MLTALFRTKSNVLLLQMSLLSLLTVCATSLTPGYPSRYLMTPCTLTPLSYSLSPLPVFSPGPLQAPCIISLSFNSLSTTHIPNSDLNPPAHVLLFAVQLHYRTSNSTPFQCHISTPRPLPQLTQLTCFPSKPSTTGTTVPTCVLPFPPHTGHSFEQLIQKLKALHSLKTLETTHPMTMSNLISTTARPS